MQMRPMFYVSFKCIIGDGRECSLFYDWWIGDCRLSDEEGVKAQIVSFGHNVKVRDWWGNDAWRIPASFSRRWPHIARRIETIQLHENSDQIQWIHSKMGQYSIASAYEVLRHREQKVQWKKCVCDSKGMPRHQFILWLVMRNSLKTKEMLNHRGMNVESSCARNHSASLVCLC